MAASSIAGIDSGGCLAPFANGSVGQVLTMGAAGPAWANPSDDQTAAEVSFTPYSTLAATSVQGAIQEIVDECCTYTEAAACASPTRFLGDDQKTYSFSDLFPPPATTKTDLPLYYQTTLPAAGTTAGVTSGTMTIANGNCRPRLCRITFQGYFFFNIRPQFNVVFDVQVQEDGNGYNRDHQVGGAMPLIPDNAAAAKLDGKSMFYRSKLLQPGESFQVDVRIDLTVADPGWTNPGSLIDMGFAFASLTGEII